MMRTLLSRFAALFRRRHHDAALDDEVRAHLDLLATDYEQRGLTPDEARLAARRAFGGVEQMKEQYRDRRGLPWLDGLARDVRYAVRGLRRNPGFTAVATLTLALGIGANTAVFSVLDAAMFQSLPVTEPQRLVIVDSDTLISYPVFERLMAEQRAVNGLLATTGPQRFVVRWHDAAAPETAAGTEVSSTYFPVLGAGLAAGRAFTEDDERPGATGVVVISHDLWERRFARGPAVIGQTVLVNGRPATIAGVAAAGFRGEVVGAHSDIWVLIRHFRTADLENRAGSFFQVMGRLRPDVSRGDAETSLTNLFRQILATETGPGTGAPQRGSRAAVPSIRLAPGVSGVTVVTERFELPLWLGLAFVALVLAVACANVAGLSLARALTHAPEIRIRAALGASRWRLICPLMAESVCLACAGGLAGVLLAYASARPLTSLLAGGLLPLTLEVTPNTRVLAFAAAVSLATGLLFGLAPALRATGGRRHRILGTSVNTAAPARQRFARALVIGQVGVSVLLLVTAGLLVSSVRNLGDVDPGFDRDGVLLVDVRAMQEPNAAMLAARFTQLRDRVMALPGVTGVSGSWRQVFDPFSDMYAPLSVEGYTPRAGERAFARYNVVSPGYFSTVGMRLVAGREFTPADAERAPRVIVVNETFARTYVAGQNPIGTIVAITEGPRDAWEPREIVGLVRDARYNDLRREIRPMFYAPFTQLPRRVQSIEVRTAGSANPVALGPSLRTVIAQVAPEWVVEDVRTMAQQVDRPIATERFLTHVTAGVGLLALGLAAVGLYGLLSYLVARRTAEVGIRMALGASAIAVISPVLRETAWMVMTGVAGGLALAMLTTRAVSGFLYGLSATDPVTVAIVTLIVVGVGFSAAYVPARRATKVNPLIALRTE